MTAVTDLLALQAEYIAWHESLPNNLPPKRTPSLILISIRACGNRATP
jgi:hypothetical protein